MVQLGNSTFQVVKLIGQGAYAKIYEVIGDDGEIKAIKVQSPPCEWEVYAVNTAISRLHDLGMTSAAHAILPIEKSHIYNDGSIFVTPYLKHGTLLDLINAKKGVRFKDAIVMWIAKQIMMLVHSLHTTGTIHGDIKPDNIMLESMDSFDFVSKANEIGGIKLIDFGRAIDMTEFPPGTAFRGDSGTSAFSCIQMQQKLPWNYHIDFYGIAGTIHVVLLGTYMQVQQGKDGKWTIKDRVKRWCNTSLWSDFFSGLLNFPTPSEEHLAPISDSPLPALISMMELDQSELEYIIPNFFKDV